MKEQNNLEHKCWIISGSLTEILHYAGMPMYDRTATIICLIMLRRIDSLISTHAVESEDFYLENKNIYSEEYLEEALKEINGGYPFYNVSGYSLSSILNSNKSIEVTFNSYLQGFSANIQEILNGLQFPKSIGFLQRQSMYLVKILNELVSINLSSTDINDKDFADFIIFLLLSGETNEHLQPTPLFLQDLITECLLSDEGQTVNKSNISIYDPVCGTGSLLVSAANRLRSNLENRVNVSVFGQDVNDMSVAIGKLLTLFNGYDSEDIKISNALIQDTFAEMNFQYILADLPFGLSWKHLQSSITHVMSSQSTPYFLELPSNTNDSQFLFLNHMISKMDPNGCRMAFISTGSMLWAGTSTSGESRIRRMLFENDMVEAIISLPLQTLKYSIPVYLWVITNHKETKKTGKVQFIQTEDKNVKKLRTSAFTTKLVNEVSTEYREYRESVTSKILSNDELGKYDVDILIGNRKETITVALNENIEEYLDKEVRPYNKEKISIDYSSVEKYYSINFNKIFVKEEKKVIPFDKVEEKVFSYIDEILSLRNEMKEFDAFLLGFVEKSKSNHFNLSLLDKSIKITRGQSRASGSVQNKEKLPYIDIKYIRGEQTTGTVCDTYIADRVSTEEDTLIITSGANAGEVFHGVKGIVSSSFFLLKSDSEKVLHQYLYYLIKAHERYFQMIASQSMSIKNLNIKSVRSLKCFLPSLALQKEMVTALDKVINKIDKITEQLGNSDNLLLHYKQTLIEKAVIGIYK